MLRPDLSVKLAFVRDSLMIKTSHEAVFIWLAASSHDLGIRTLKSLCNTESVLSHPSTPINLPGTHLTVQNSIPQSFKMKSTHNLAAAMLIKGVAAGMVKPAIMNGTEPNTAKTFVATVTSDYSFYCPVI
jgi:hypothetical protein